MRKTFVCDESMIITIPIGSLRDLRDGQLMPEKFHCVFRDSYKVFVIKGKPTPMGVSLNFLLSGWKGSTGAVDASNEMCFLIFQTKLSFSLNIISFFWSVAAFSLALVAQGISVLIMTLLVVENLIAIFLIYWLSKAVCREHFNTLPTVLLKQGD
uniref:Uncharacterized protein n=1 Tax=Pundamilia nyererei TaxID=303518 RepID=A0A3B4GDJ3_9CICH